MIGRDYSLRVRYAYYGYSVDFDSSTAYSQAERRAAANQAVIERYGLTPPLSYAEPGSRSRFTFGNASGPRKHAIGIPFRRLPNIRASKPARLRSLDHGKNNAGR